MLRPRMLRGVSAGALGFALSSAAVAQEALPTIDISGSDSGTRAAAPGPAAPAKETGYARKVSFGATKTDTPLLDTPIAVQIVPHEVIEDKQALNTMEAVKNVSGVQAQGGTYYDQYLIRGFKSGYGVTWRNGLQLEGLLGGEEIAFTDRVEIVKGPGSVLYGRIEPGGFVNTVTKRPQEEFKAELNEQFGSWGLSRTTADVTGAFDKEKTVLYRVIGVFDHADSFTDYDHRDNAAGALFLTFRPTQNFEFNVGFEYYAKKQTQPDGSGTVPVNLLFDGNGRPVVIKGVNDRPYNLPRHFSISDPSIWSDFPYTVNRTLYSYDWTYKFDDKWRITNRFHYVDDRENQTGLGNFGGFDGVNLTRTFVHGPLTRQILSTNLDLAGEIVTGPLTHKLLAGVDWYEYQDDWVGDYGFALPFVSPINVFSPGPTGYFTPILHGLADSARTNVLWRSREQDFGVYAQDQISLLDGRVQILLGGRWDEATVGNASTYGGALSSCFPVCNGYPLKWSPNSPRLSPRAGVLIKVTDNISAYGSYVRSFGSNNSSSTADGRVIPPEEAFQWEAGVKALWLDGRLSTSVTLFDLTKTNVLEDDPLNPGFSIPAGTVNSRGVEVDVSGQVTENLSVIASYTFDSAKIVDDNGNGNNGKRFNSVAPNVGNIWAKWNTAPGAREGFEFGFGVYAMDDRWGSDANTWKMPGYVKFDTMGAYRMVIAGHDVKLQLNVKNLTDRRYFESSDTYGFAYYGAPRTFIGSVNFKF